MTEQQEEGGRKAECEDGKMLRLRKRERGRRGGEVLNSTEDYHGILPRERSCCYS